MSVSRRSKRRTPTGASPGTLVADPLASAPAIRVTGYGPDADQLIETTVERADQLSTLIDSMPVVWVDVVGLGDVELIRELGETFGLHQLALEDVVNTHQRPKTEEYDDHVFIVTRMPGDGVTLPDEQLTLFLGKGYVLSFQESHTGGCLEPVRTRLRRYRSRLREAGADYLAYALLDAVIDAYFPLLEVYGEQVDMLETRVLEHLEIGLVGEIHQLKRKLLDVRRILWPQREALNVLIRENSPLVSEHTQIYLRDCYDHTVQLMDMVETYREIASGLIDIHLSSASARMNEIMKVLTIIATIFIPLGFIAGLYGMNFDRQASPWNMPELGWYFGYPLALALMVGVALGLLGYFHRKGWIGRALTGLSSRQR